MGVLAVQGAFAAHRARLDALGASTVEVRQPPHLDGIDALVIPGGESTTISMMLERTELFEPVAQRLADGMPALGTCAGMILLASEVSGGRPDQRWFSAIDISVHRNGYGRQIDSFETDLMVRRGADSTESDPLHAVFIRAPKVTRVGEAVEVLAEVDGDPVLCRQGSVVVASFHPELTEDPRIHNQLLSLIED